MTNATREQEQSTLAEVAVESWRFARLFARVVAKLDAGEGGRHLNQYRYYLQSLEDSLSKAGLRLVNLEGQPFDPGMAASAINAGDFAFDDLLHVEQMIEPIVLGPEGVIKAGTVMLGKRDA